jgi:hypothetical protein
LLTRAARAALLEADRLADQLVNEDPLLGVLQQQEASRLRLALELVLPEISRINSAAFI